MDTNYLGSWDGNAKNGGSFRGGSFRGGSEGARHSPMVPENDYAEAFQEGEWAYVLTVLWLGPDSHYFLLRCRGKLSSRCIQGEGFAFPGVAFFHGASRDESFILECESIVCENKSYIILLSPRPHYYRETSDTSRDYHFTSRCSQCEIATVLCIHIRCLQELFHSACSVKALQLTGRCSPQLTENRTEPCQH